MTKACYKYLHICSKQVSASSPTQKMNQIEEILWHQKIYVNASRKLRGWDGYFGREDFTDVTINKEDRTIITSVPSIE